MERFKRRKLLTTVIVLMLILTMVFPMTAYAKRSGAVNKSVNNPEFTVQYYAGIPSYEKDGDPNNALPIIDTQGQVLPTNDQGENVKNRNIYVDDDGELLWDYSLMPVYTEEKYEFFSAPGLNYFDKVSHSSANYDLREVWIMKDGCTDSESIAWKDWTAYKEVDKYPLQFTNDPASVANVDVSTDVDRPGGDVVEGREGRVALIDDNTVIRLIYELNEGSGYSYDATFYDFDISDGNIYIDKDKSRLATDEEINDGVTPLYIDTTGGKGINSASNYTGAGAKYAFGNANAGVGDALQNQKINGYFINRGNTAKDNPGCVTFYGACFGLANKVLEPDGAPMTGRSDIQTPNIFMQDKEVTGRTEISDWNLSFNRQGDTYTLESVHDAQGAELDGAKNLSQFISFPKYGGGKLWTNNFWPMDSAPWNNTQGHDPTSGDKLPGSEDQRVRNTEGGQMPPSDDGKAHNNYFGMTYSIDFTIDEGYCGPLNYMFYGDDDMWVYLDGKLVADIGGVHASIGIYVDLWDYIKQGEESSHTLQIFYTERGASGSSCFMQFTIPQSQVTTPTAPVVDMVIDKTVVKDAEGTAAADDTFEFEIAITDENGRQYQNNYCYYVLDENDDQLELVYVPAGTESVTEQLKDGYKIVIPSLPLGSQYVIGEVTDASLLDESTPEPEYEYTPAASSDDPNAVAGEAEGYYTIAGAAENASEPAPAVDGQEPGEAAHWVHFTNTAKTPAVDLVIDKTVVSEDGEESEDDVFEFRLSLTDADGDALAENYSYYVLDANGAQAQTGTIAAGADEVVFQLKDGYVMVVPGLPEGTKYVIGEVTDASLLDESTPEPEYEYTPAASSDDPNAVAGEAEGYYTIAGAAENASEPAPAVDGQEPGEAAHWVHFTNTTQPPDNPPDEPPKEPEDPPEDPDTPDEPSEETPKTADSMNLAAWLMAAAVSATLLALVVALMRLDFIKNRQR